jgi:hypothetical protein
LRTIGREFEVRAPLAIAVDAAKRLVGVFPNGSVRPQLISCRRGNSQVGHSVRRRVYTYSHSHEFDSSDIFTALSVWLFGAEFGSPHYRHLIRFIRERRLARPEIAGFMKASGARPKHNFST